MKPWPKELAERYPLAPDRLPERPWWQNLTQDTILRAEGEPARVYASIEYSDPATQQPVTPFAGGMFGVRTVWGSSGHATPTEAAAAHDRAYPLPFPGLRVGQIWAIFIPDLKVFQITEYDAENEADAGPPDKLDRLVTTHGTAVRVINGRCALLKPWRAGDWITEAELLDLCQDGYLLHDAVCPWLAPWAGPEKA